MAKYVYGQSPTSATKVGKSGIKIYNGTNLAKASAYAQSNSAKLSEWSTRANMQEAQNAREFQQFMSEHSHQMEVEDLQRAGLNPVLSANNGAQSYTSAQASATGYDSSSAVASLLGAKYSSDKSLQGANASASATMYAAKQSADATKYAARKNLEAAKYSSDNAKEASNYAADSSKYGMLHKFINDSLEAAKKTDANNFIKRNDNKNFLKNIAFNDCSKYYQKNFGYICEYYGMKNTYENRKAVYYWMKNGNTKKFSNYVKQHR